MKREGRIGDKTISSSHQRYIIVETRANYHRDIKTVIKLINHADEAGVGVVKFQTYKAEELYSKYAPKFFRDNVDLFDLIKANEVVRS